MMHNASIAEIALLCVAGVDAVLAVRGLRNAHADRRTLIRDKINGAALLAARALIRVERLRLVFRLLFAGLAAFLLTQPPNAASRTATMGVLIAVVIVDAFKSWMLNEARKDVDAIERARAKGADPG